MTLDPRHSDFLRERNYAEQMLERAHIRLDRANGTRTANRRAGSFLPGDDAVVDRLMREVWHWNQQLQEISALISLQPCSAFDSETRENCPGEFDFSDYLQRGPELCPWCLAGAMGLPRNESAWGDPNLPSKPHRRTFSTPPQPAIGSPFAWGH